MSLGYRVHSLRTDRGKTDGIQPRTVTEGLVWRACNPAPVNAHASTRRGGGKSGRWSGNGHLPDSAWLSAGGSPAPPDRRQTDPPDILARLDRLDSADWRVADLLVSPAAVKDWYTTAEVARIIGKAEFTVREYCRLGRVRAEKLPCGRGKYQEWIVSHEELTRLRNEGLLPLRKH